MSLVEHERLFIRLLGLAVPLAPRQKRSVFRPDLRESAREHEPFAVPLVRVRLVSRNLVLVSQRLEPRQLGVVHAVPRILRFFLGRPELLQGGVHLLHQVDVELVVLPLHALAPLVKSLGDDGARRGLQPLLHRVVLTAAVQLEHQGLATRRLAVGILGLSGEHGGVLLRQHRGGFGNLRSESLRRADVSLVRAERVPAREQIRDGHLGRERRAPRRKHGRGHGHVKGDAALRRRRRPVRLPLGRRFLGGSLAAAGVLLRAQLRDARRRVLPERRRAKRRGLGALRGSRVEQPVEGGVGYRPVRLGYRVKRARLGHPAHLHPRLRRALTPDRIPERRERRRGHPRPRRGRLRRKLHPRSDDLAVVILFDDHLAPPDRRGVQTLQRHRHRELPVVIVGGLDVDEGLGYGRDGDGGNGQDSSVERVVFGHQGWALVGRERGGDGELDGRAVEHGVLGPNVLLLLGGTLAAGFGLGLGGLVAVGGRLGLGFGQVPLERNLRQRVRSADRLDAGREREHVDADGSDRGLAPVNGDDHGRCHERGYERGAGRPALERLDVIEDARAIFAGLDGLRLHGPLLAGKGERHLDGLGGRGFRLLLALGLDPRGDERGDRLGEKGKERWRGAGSATRNLRRDPKKARRRVAGRGGARGRDAHLDGHVYGERGRTRILGSLGLPIGVSRFLLAHGLAL